MASSSPARESTDGLETPPATPAPADPSLSDDEPDAARPALDVEDNHSGSVAVSDSIIPEQSGEQAQAQQETRQVRPKLSVVLSVVDDNHSESVADNKAAVVPTFRSCADVEEPSEEDASADPCELPALSSLPQHAEISTNNDIPVQFWM